MRKLWIAVGALALIGAGAARAQAVDEPRFATAADVAAVIASAKADAKPGAANTMKSIFALAPYNAALEFHQGVGQAAVHENQAELIIVVEGTGTEVLGGQLIDPKRANAHNLTATAIQGGVSHPFAKGDMWFVPEGAPHQLNADAGGVSVITLHVPRPVAAP